YFPTPSPTDISPLSLHDALPIYCACADALHGNTGSSSRCCCDVRSGARARIQRFAPEIPSEADAASPDLERPRQPQMVSLERSVESEHARRSVHHSSNAKRIRCCREERRRKRNRSEERRVGKEERYR